MSGSFISPCTQHRNPVILVTCQREVSLAFREKMIIVDRLTDRPYVLLQKKMWEHHTWQSMRRVVCSGTGFLSLKMASMVDSRGVNSIFASSAVPSSRRDSI